MAERTPHQNLKPGPGPSPGPGDGSDCGASNSSDSFLDPLFVHAKRELKFALVIFAVFAVWVVGYSWFAGRTAAADPDNLATVLGMPAWVFWGVALPWVLANVVTFWFCFRVMADDPLDIVQEEQPDFDESPHKGTPHE